MAKKAYIGVDNVARKIKKGYVGIEGKARKIKKAYIGIGGVARPCWSGGELAYYGTITPLSGNRNFNAATSLESYGLISSTGKVDAYDKQLVKTVATATFSDTRVQRLAATTVGNYALFGGGCRNSYEASTSAWQNTVYAYTNTLTQSTPTVLNASRAGLAATTVGNYALFAGGENYDSGNFTTVDVYNTSLTHSTGKTLTTSRCALSATTIGDYAIFAGGLASQNSSFYQSGVDAYDKSLTKITISDLSTPSAYMGATTLGNYAIFAGGGHYETQIATVNVYNKSLTRTNPTNLSQARFRFDGATLGEYAIFAGGGYGDHTATYGRSFSKVVDVYNPQLTRTVFTSLTEGRGWNAATTIGDFALFGGGSIYYGSGGTQETNIVEAFTLV